MIAFVMNAMAWEPVIKEKHWFGMNEYYNAPVFGVTNYADVTVQNSGFGNLDGWSADCSNNTFHSEGRGNIGSWKVHNHANIKEATEDDNHPGWMSCIGLECRWSGSWSSYTQTVNNLPTGVYKLSYDVMNGNSQTTPATTYENLFYVEINGSRYTDLQTEWMSGSTTWTTHTIEFRISGTANVKISLGYGTGSNHYPLENTPALYVSRLNLQSAENKGSYKVSTINWENNFLESMVVTRDWTYDGYSPNPKTSFYSWLDHKKRFSVDHTDFWWPGRNTKLHNVLGLKNFSNSAENFRIHDLNAGDQINIEYYRDPNNTDVPHLVSGDLSSTNDENGKLTTGSSIYGAQNNTPTFYTVLSNGDLCFDIPRGAIIRSVTIILKKYEKATAEVTPLTQEEQTTYGGKGYRYTLKGSGVLEDKRGAVPYITMRFGAEKDMTFVRDLGNNQFGAACIVDGSNDLNPATAKLQEYDKIYTWEVEGVKHYYNYTEEDVRTRLEGKEWTVFTAEQWLPESGKKGDLFNSIFPLYGSYYYFFPEVDGKLIVTYYCEGKNDGPAFWWKVKDLNQLKTSYSSQTEYDTDKNFPGVGDQPKWLDRTNGSNVYTFEVDVKKDGVYYLCSNPTNIQHEHPIIRLMSYAFVPNFRVDPLYKVVGNAATTVSDAATITGLSDKGVVIERFTGASSDGTLNNSEIITINGEDAPMIKFLGNVEGATIKLRGTASDGIKLDFSNITYKKVDNVNKGGAIVVNLECPAGKATFVLTIAYEAADANMDMSGNRVRSTTNNDNPNVKRWDFYSGAGDGADGYWDLGKHTDSSSKLYKETHKADGLTADWVDTYVNLTDGKNERFFKSVYDMEGDNADMIHETAGLIFLTYANQLGIMNENDEPTAQFQDRYIGLMKGSKFTIPLLDAGDRIVLKMGTYNNEQVTLGMTNAKDVSSVGKTIGNNYIIGGSVPVEGDDKDANGHVVPRGEYHIQAIANGDVDIEVVDGQLLKLYTIEIYRNAANNNADILTENSVTTADGPEMLFTDEDAATKDMEFYLRYSGNEEPKVFDEYDNNYTRGNLGRLNADSFSDGSTEGSKKVSLMNTDFGSFRAVAKVKTTDAGNTYVTDYAKGSLAVDYLKKVEDGYPYTWDFTDLLYIKNTSDKYIENAIQTEKGGDLVTDYKGWVDNAGTLSLRNAPEQEPGILFANGGQIYGANVMFAEMAGIGFKRSTESPEDAKLLNKAMGIKSGALELNSKKEGVFYKLVVPKVDADAAIYVRATPIEDAKFVAKYSTDGENATDFKVLSVTTPNDDATDDKIYVMKNEGGEQNIELWLNGMVIKKIAVATDEKKVNDEGWNTESRAHATDPTLLPYMTGKDFRTYIVKEGGIDATNKVVTLQRVDGGKGKDSDGSEDKDDKNTIVIPAATDGSLNACIVRYVGDKDGENIFEDGNGFHLFAPDMHDKPAANAKIPNSLLRAQVSNTDDSQVVPREQTIEGTTYYNYAFTNKYKYVDEDGEQLEGREGQYTGKQAFYRIMASGAKSGGNQAYLSITTSPAPTRLVLFIDGEDSEATGIATVENSVGGENARFYNLNGQQLSGKPNRSGLYIVNGKKVSIKNK